MENFGLCKGNLKIKKFSKYRCLERKVFLQIEIDHEFLWKRDFAMPHVPFLSYRVRIGGCLFYKFQDVQK